MQRYSSRIVGILFLLIIFTPLIFFSLYGEDQGRYLWRFMKGSNSNAKFVSMNPLLKRLDTFSAWIRYHLLGITPHYRFYHHDGWFLARSSDLKEGGEESLSLRGLDDHLGLNSFSEEELAEWIQTIRARDRLLASKGIEYVLAIVPRKSSIYPRKVFPHNLQDSRGTTRLEQLHAALDKHQDLSLVDLTSELRRGKEQDETFPRLYFKTDGHWNQYGAYFGYRGIIKEVSSILDDVPIKPLPLSTFDVKQEADWCHPGFWRRSGLCIEEPFPLFVPRKGNPLREVPIYRKDDKELPRGLQLYQPTRQEWRDERDDTRNLLVKEGIGHLYYPATFISDSNGRQQKYQVIRNYGDPQLKSIMVLSASFGEKLLYYLAAHTEKLFRYKETRGFKAHFLRANNDDLRSVELVLQVIPEGVVSSGAPLKRPSRNS